MSPNQQPAAGASGPDRPTTERPVRGLAVAALAVGVLAAATAWFSSPLGVTAGGIAIVLGVLAAKRSQPRWMWLVGMLAGTAAVVLVAVKLVLAVLMIDQVLSDPEFQRELEKLGH